MAAGIARNRRRHVLYGLFNTFLYDFRTGGGLYDLFLLFLLCCRDRFCQVCFWFSDLHTVEPFFHAVICIFNDLCFYFDSQFFDHNRYAVADSDCFKCLYIFIVLCLFQILERGLDRYFGFVDSAFGVGFCDLAKHFFCYDFAVFEFVRKIHRRAFWAGVFVRVWCVDKLFRKGNENRIWFFRCSFFLFRCVITIWKYRRYHVADVSFLLR